jgi:hypothetical protein
MPQTDRYTQIVTDVARKYLKIVMGKVHTTGKGSGRVDEEGKICGGVNVAASGG